MSWKGRRTGHGERRVARRRALSCEALESRRLLAVDAVDDLYEIEEGSFFNANASPIVASRSNWTYFPWLTNNPLYPADATPGDSWHDRGYDTATPDFGNWFAPAPAPFTLGNIDGLGAATPRTALPSVAGQTTVLFRSSFSLTPAQAFAGPMRYTIGVMCDDGCAGYINGVEVFRSNLGEGPIEANQYADANVTDNDESRFRFFDFDVAQRGAPLFADAANVLAVEVHQSRPTSDDLAFDAVLYAGNIGLRANDAIVDAGPQVRAYYLPPGGDPATTSSSSGNVLDAATQTSVVGEVSINPNTGGISYSPRAWEYNGDATFQYVLRDDTSGDFDVATVTMRIAPFNDPPVAKNDVYYHVAGRGPLAVADGGATTLIAAGSESMWHYNDDSTDQSALNPAWNSGPDGGFDPSASAWKTGLGPLGFGEQNLPLVTILNWMHPNPQNHSFETIPAYYFHRTFDAPADVDESLRLNLLYDDCAIVYINGLEAVRTANFPANGDWQSRCTEPNWNEFEVVEFRTAVHELDLRPTGNVIAVEVHNQLVSEDSFFDLTLSHAPHGLLENDVDNDDPREELAVEVVDASQFTPEVGVLDVRPDGSFTFTPASDAVSGTFSFTYRVVDDGAPSGPAEASPPATATIHVAACVCNADVTGDAAVDGADLAAVVAAFGATSDGGEAPLAGDVNGDGRVGIRDAIAVRNRMTPTASASADATIARRDATIVRRDARAELQARAATRRARVAAVHVDAALAALAIRQEGSVLVGVKRSNFRRAIGR